MDKTIYSLLNKLYNKHLLLCIISVLFVIFNVSILLSINEVKNKEILINLSPVTALELKGQEVYYQAGCQYCHSQALSSKKWELKRFSKAKREEFYPLTASIMNFSQSPSLRGSQRIGPDLSHISHLQKENKLRTLLNNDSNQTIRLGMHNYYYLFEKELSSNAVWFSWKMKAMLQTRTLLSEPYTRSLFSEFEDKTEGDALIHYLLNKGKKYKQFQENYYQQ